MKNNKKSLNSNRKKKIIIFMIVLLILIVGIFLFRFFHLFQGKVYSDTGDDRKVNVVFTSYDEFHDYVGDNKKEILKEYNKNFFQKNNLAFISENTSSSGGIMRYKSAIIFGDTVKIHYKYYDGLTSDCAIGEFYIVLKVPKSVIKVEGLGY